METTINSEIGEPSRANDQETIPKFTQGELDIIHKQVTKSSEEAKTLCEESLRGSSTSCIYRVLPRLKKINGEPLYEPNLVSIGPYYYKLHNEKFQMAEDCKWKCFGLLVRDRGLDMQQQINTYKRCLQKISELEEKIRGCYSEEIEVSGIEFLEMMILDACFIIAIMETWRYDIMAAWAWMVPYCYRDFLLLENQIPFFVLEEIYAIIHNISVGESRGGLLYSALEFFTDGMKGYHIMPWTIFEMDTVPVLHLLDLVRTRLIPSISRHRRKLISKTKFIHCISKLRLAGIKVSQGKEGMSFLEVKFKRGVIEMPNIAIDDLMRCVLLNSVAFEQCQQTSSKYFSVYATFLDCLVNTEEDVEYLRECNVIDNYLADDSELAGFINRAGKDLVFDYSD